MTYPDCTRSYAPIYTNHFALTELSYLLLILPVLFSGPNDVTATARSPYTDESPTKKQCGPTTNRKPVYSETLTTS